jgi:hypothetical protein
VQGIYKKKLSETIYFIARRLSHPYCSQSLNLGHEKLLMNFAKLKFDVARSHGHQFPEICIYTLQKIGHMLGSTVKKKRIVIHRQRVIFCCQKVI